MSKARDNDADGLHKIANTENDERIADVVFVHGLGGASHSTWTYEGSAGGASFFWPEELGRDQPQLGIWSIGYPAGFVELDRPGMIIDKRAGNLAQKLANAGLGDRPIAFITHSMGGLIVKSLLVYSGMLPDEDRSRLASMTRGIVFCATPHRGSGLADLAEKLGAFLGGAQAHVLEMRANGDSIDLLHERFVEWHTKNPIQIVSYAENFGLGRKSVIIRAVPRGTALSEVVVSRSSANTGIQKHVLHDVDEDHLSIVKPSDRMHDVYAGTSRFLQKLFTLPPPLPAPAAAPPPNESTTLQGELSVKVGGATSDVVPVNSRPRWGMWVALAIVGYAVLWALFSKPSPENDSLSKREKSSMKTSSPEPPSAVPAEVGGDSQQLPSDVGVTLERSECKPITDVFGAAYSIEVAGSATLSANGRLEIEADFKKALRTATECQRWISASNSCFRFPSPDASSSWVTTFYLAERPQEEFRLSARIRGMPSEGLKTQNFAVRCPS